MTNTKKIAIIGAGPSGLFILKRLVEVSPAEVTVEIFEKTLDLGPGMPYSEQGALPEHITNLSANEVPGLVTPIGSWVESVAANKLPRHQIDPERFTNDMVLPRLFLGEYLRAQFALLCKQALDKGIKLIIHPETTVNDIIDRPALNKTEVQSPNGHSVLADRLVICSGHYWPKKFEDTVPGYFESPYPPQKLQGCFNHPVAIKGASLTAIDAVRSLARRHGKFVYCGLQTVYEPDKEYPDFRMVLYSDNGLLPAVRNYLDDSELRSPVLTDEEISSIRQENGGFVPLDLVFERLFKEPLSAKDPEAYENIKGSSLEEFVSRVMAFRESKSPFKLLKAEYVEACRSIHDKQPIYWKELLGALSFAMNHPAKYFSAEDMLRLKKTLMPLIAVVIAFLPQSSAEELLALAEAGTIEMVTVGEKSQVIPQADKGIVYRCQTPDGKIIDRRYYTYIDCTGQPALEFEEIPFPGLINHPTASPAFLRFRDQQTVQQLHLQENEKIFQDQRGDYFLQVPGAAVNDNFQLIDRNGSVNPRIFMLSIPCIGGFNPDYSGLDFCQSASVLVVQKLLE